MKKALFLSLASSMLAVSAWAWDAPVEPVKPTQAGEFVAGHSYFIRNVGSGQYLTGANAWGTQSSMTTAGINDAVTPAIPYLISETTQTVGGVELTGYTLRMNGTCKLGDRTFTDTYLFRDSETDAYVDHGSQDKGLVWNITKVDNYYRIQTAEGDPAYPNAATQYAGWDSTDGAIEIDPETGDLLSGSTVVKYNMTGEGENENIDWEFIPCDDYIPASLTYPARVELYELLQRAEEYNVDASAAGAVYTDANATVEQLQAAKATLEAEVNRQYYADRWAGASASNPMDVTDDCLKNPAFEDGNINGWDNTFKSGVNADNCGYQGAHYENEGVVIDKFIEAWANCWANNTAKLGDAQLSQTVYGLPKGQYRLEADAIAVAQAQSSWNPVTGVYLFIKAGRFEEKVAMATNNEKPQHFTVEFLNEGADELTFGLKTESCNANWMAADNFRIYYLGELQGSVEQLMLEKTLEEYASVGDGDCNAELYSAWENAISDGEDLLDNGTDEQCLAQIEVIKNAHAAVLASQADYVELQKVLAETSKLASDIDQNHSDWDDLYNAINNLATEIGNKLDNQTADHEYLESVRDKATNMLREYIAGGVSIKAGDDLTVLIENADFQKTDPESKTIVPGWTTVSGEITELSKEWGDIEVYCKLADIQQTLKNMPMGAYDIIVQGFVRGDNNQVQLYAGDSKTSFKNISQEYSDEPSFGTPEEIQELIGSQGHPWPMDSPDENTVEGQTVYRPNSMQGASLYFAKTNPATGKPFYENTCRIILTKPGDLTIGVRVLTNENIWVLWDNFRIVYQGNTAALYSEEVYQRQAVLEAVLNDETKFVTAQARTIAETAINEALASLNGDDVNAVIAALKKMEEAEVYVNNAAALAAELRSLAEYYEAASQLVQSSDADYLNLIDKSLNPTTETFQSNEAINAAIKGLKEGWAHYVMCDIKDVASLDNQMDVSEIIYNSTYVDPITQEDSEQGWTITTDGGTHTASFEGMECYNNESFRVSQELIGLEPGFYTLGVSGFYRSGFPAADYDGSIHNVMLYAENASHITWKSELMNALEGGQYGPEGIGSESQIGDIYIPNNTEAANTYLTWEYYAYNECVFEVGEDGKITIGLYKNEHIDGDWAYFSNWKLYYMGKTAPDAISSTKEATEKNNVLFDLSGRRVNKNFRGIVITNGKKLLVK